MFLLKYIFKKLIFSNAIVFQTLIVNNKVTYSISALKIISQFGAYTFRFFPKIRQVCVYTFVCIIILNK